MTTRMLLPLSLLTLALPAAAHSQAPEPCAGVPHCTATSTFVATLSDFRESTASYSRLLSVTVRFQNRTTEPLTLAYVAGSGLGTDDQGNRYEAQSQSLRGLGEVRGNTFDAKFTLRPGETADARLEFAFRPGRAILGTRFVLELAVREIDPLPGNQWRLGREHSLQWQGLGEAPVVAAAPVTPAPTAPAGDATPAPEPPVDPCADKERCYATGPFMAEVTRFSDSKVSYYHILTYTVRFRNLSSEPLVLAYAGGTAVALDDQGNRYVPSGSNHLKGMGISQGNRADPSFRLKPGEARDATFQVTFRPGRAVLGTVYTFDFAVEELEILPRNQIRTAREYTIGFRDLTLSGASPASAAKGVLDALRGRRP